MTQASGPAAPRGDWWKLPVSLAVPQAVGAVAGLATAPGVRAWYPGLEKPAFTPPDEVFAPAWIGLYLLMGIALWLVWRRGASAPGVRTALALFGVQLVLNGAWSFLFFGLRDPRLAFAGIVALWLAVGATISAFSRRSSIAGLLLVPYWAWVTFAAALNWSIWRLNA